MDHDHALYDEIYTAAVVMARVGHLEHAQQREIELITRTVRDSFDGSAILRPKQKITRILLIGFFAQRTCARQDGATGPRTYDFWIIVNDPLLTRSRLWQSTEVQIQRALGQHCGVRLRFSTARKVRKAKRTGDVLVIERLNSGITLFRAKRDAPGSWAGKGRGPWSKALLRFNHAEDAFRPASEQLRDAERAWFADRTIELSSAAAVAVRDRRRLDKAIADEKRQGDRLHAATVALLHTPAPDLGAIVRKLELVRDVGDGDDPATVSILADIRWIAARLAQMGNLP